MTDNNNNNNNNCTNITDGQQHQQHHRQREKQKQIRKTNNIYATETETAAKTLRKQQQDQSMVLTCIYQDEPFEYQHSEIQQHQFVPGLEMVEIEATHLLQRHLCQGQCWGVSCRQGLPPTGLCFSKHIAAFSLLLGSAQMLVIACVFLTASASTPKHELLAASWRGLKSK